jgi:hypothetical protein
VRASEHQCPFCATALEPAELATKVVPAANQRMGRNAMFVFATTLALGACASPTNPGDGGSDARADVVQSETGPQDDGGPMPLYGGPVPSDSGPEAGPSPADAGDAGGMALYGGPTPVDAGSDSALNQDGGGVGPLYGGPFPADANDDGNPGLRYGAPPVTRDA